ncbi:tetratricopeptide repeat protein [Moraxella marmotae]|uniref:tetratricopeptide repeat protein n=1 Tax=Moraxella marmotae TaxID=3344520 RepID=UPI0035F32E6D
MNQSWHRNSPLKRFGDTPKVAHRPFGLSKFHRFGKVAIAAAIASASITPAYANVFDPLLKILLPFYKPITSENGDLPTPADANPTVDADNVDTDTADTASDDVVPSLPDDTTDIDTPADSAIPAILLDDTLIANDIEPMLDTPDLDALLTAEFAADRGEIAKALAIYKAESFKQNATSVFERALSLSIEFETPKQSLAFATAWQDRNPEHIPAWFYVTHLALKAGEYKQAAAMLSTILHYDPRSDLGQILTGIIPQNPNDKRALFYALQGIRHDNASVSVLRAGILMGLNDYEAARLHIEQALASEPNNLAFITLKLNILRAANRMDELWQYLHQVRKKQPKEKELYLYEARHFIESGNLTQAWQLLTQAVKNTKDNDVTLLAALVGLDSGRYLAAVELLKPLTHTPKLANQAHYYLGIGYERLGDTVNARQHFEQVNDYEHALDASSKVVGFYLAENNTDAAIKTLIRLRDEFEAYATDSYILQAEIYLRQDNKQKAKDLLTIANREYPDDDRLLYASYQLLENELEPEDKRQAINQLLKIASFNPYYRLADAKLRLADNPDDADALGVALEVSNISFDNPDYDSQLQLDALLVLANHALAQNNYDAVIDYLQAPYEVSPTLNVGITLLRAYQGLGDGDAVQKLLADLQSRFMGNQAGDDDSQIY